MKTKFVRINSEGVVEGTLSNRPTVCENCWGDAYLRMLSNGKSQAENYRDLLEERKDNPCKESVEALSRFEASYQRFENQDAISLGIGQECGAKCKCKHPLDCERLKPGTELALEVEVEVMEQTRSIEDEDDVGVTLTDWYKYEGLYFDRNKKRFPLYFRKVLRLK